MPGPAPTGRAAAHRPPAAGARVHRPGDPRARLSAERAGDRRGGRPLVALHGPRAPRGAPGQGLPAPRPDQAARDRGHARADHRRGRRAPTGPPRPARSATSPPAPACSRPRTSKRCCPLPEDFTGDGELFMLRVRGESMIDVGIFDGDFVVVRAQPDGRQRRHRRRRNPRRRGDGEDVPAQAQQDRAAARPTRRWTTSSSTPTTSRSTARSSRCCAGSDTDERAEHLGAPHAASTPVRRTRPRCARARDRRARSCRPGCRGRRSARRRSSRASAAHRPGRLPTSSATSGFARFGGAAGDALTTSSVVGIAEQLVELARSRRRASATARTRRFTTSSQRSGTTLLATPPSMRTTCSDSR